MKKRIDTGYGDFYIHVVAETVRNDWGRLTVRIEASLIEEETETWWTYCREFAEMPIIFKKRWRKIAERKERKAIKRLQDYIDDLAFRRDLDKRLYESLDERRATNEDAN